MIVDLRQIELLRKRKSCDNLEKAKNEDLPYLDRIKSLSLYWKDNESDILKHHSKYPHGWFESYAMDYSRIFTQIEVYAWSAIRCTGNIPFYPQYPVGKYIVDFGNPYRRIAVELDGKEYHNADKDRIRDIELQKLGWTVFRITGSDMHKTSEFSYYEIENDYCNDYITRSECCERLDEYFSTGDSLFRVIRLLLCKELYMDYDSFGYEFAFPRIMQCLDKFMTTGTMEVSDRSGEFNTLFEKKI